MGGDVVVVSKLFYDENLVVPKPEDNPALSADRRRTLRRQAMLDSGVHPATRSKLQGGAETCRSCAHSEKINGYWKCDLVPRTGGPGTDIHVSWPACVKWEADGPSTGDAR